jgi:cell division protein FtsI (penicillin-binding protein 3)
MASYGNDSTKSIRRRLVACGVIFSLLLAVVLGRAAQLQLFQGDRLAEWARDQYVRSIELQPRRGPIVDAHNRSLAASVEAESVYVDPKEFKKLPDGTQLNLERQLAKTLSLEKDTLHRHLTGAGAFAWLKRRISPVETEALRKISLEKTGIKTVREYQRYYPQKQLAAHVIGLVGIDNDGLDGVERVQNEAIKGESVELASVRDAHGKMLLQEAGLSAAIPEGATVQLTIDSTIQQATEDALRQGMARTKAIGSMAVVMDPRTGAILALANAPTFNPNAPGEMDSRRNRAVTDTYEPGSVMKCFVLSGAIADGVVTPQTPIEVTGGRLQIGRKTIRDSHAPHTNMETVTEVLAVSSNVGAARVGLRLGPERVVAWLKSFGFGERTKIALPGEGRGILQDPKHMGDIGTATTSFGQGMTASALQVTTALSALANDGRLMRPFIVRKIVQTDGEVLLDQQPEFLRQAVPPEAAHALAEMMTHVTNKGGTGTQAAIPGFRVAGKTGTAQKADPRTHTYGSKRFASFMGFVPAEDPKLAIYVAFDEPVGDVYGGLVAAPVFREIATAALLQLGVTAAGVDPLQEPAPVKGHVAPAKKETAPVSDEHYDEDDDLPEASDDVAAAAGTGGAVVPDLRGLSAREALKTLFEHQFEADLESGSGRVVSQRPEPGRAVMHGTKVHVVLEAG